MHVTEAESEVLGALWRRGPMSFASLIDEVTTVQAWGGATVKTLLGRLMRKGLIASERTDGRQSYRPTITRDDYVASEIQALADRLFDGDVEALARRLTARP
ncbi:BlaI/MecI/CopY family transcriptional regulator [Phenylobacterium sp.]|uniref:BlaI/MecI/CopY family transcriptional regulator n=1 Tax=Phenylobacterium sp. TaxID=1871053 RepID=UPI002FC8F3A6